MFPGGDTTHKIQNIQNILKIICGNVNLGANVTSTSYTKVNKKNTFPLLPV